MSSNEGSFLCFKHFNSLIINPGILLICFCCNHSFFPQLKTPLGSSELLQCISGALPCQNRKQKNEAKLDVRIKSKKFVFFKFFARWQFLGQLVVYLAKNIENK